MTEFEKRFSKLDDIQITRFTKQNRVIARNAWKAALEWALKNLEEQYEHTARGDTGWQGKFIEQELKES